MASTMRVGGAKFNRTGRSRFARWYGAADRSGGHGDRRIRGAGRRAPGPPGYLGAASFDAAPRRLDCDEHRRARRRRGRRRRRTGPPSSACRPIRPAARARRRQLGDRCAARADERLQRRGRRDASDGVNLDHRRPDLRPGVYNVMSSWISPARDLQRRQRRDATWGFQAGSTLTTRRAARRPPSTATPATSTGSTAAPRRRVRLLVHWDGDGECFGHRGDGDRRRPTVRQERRGDPGQRPNHQPVCSLPTPTAPRSGHTPSPFPAASSAPTASGSASPEPGPVVEHRSTPAPSASATTPGGGATRARGPRAAARRRPPRPGPARYRRVRHGRVGLRHVGRHLRFGHVGPARARPMQGTLATTGSDVQSPLGIAAALLAAGGILLAAPPLRRAARRRRSARAL